MDGDTAREPVLAVQENKYDKMASEGKPYLSCYTEVYVANFDDFIKCSSSKCEPCSKLAQVNL